MLIREMIVFSPNEYREFCKPLQRWHILAQHVAPQDEEKAEQFYKSVKRLCNETSHTRVILGHSYDAWMKIRAFLAERLKNAQEEQKKYTPEQLSTGIIARPWQAEQLLIESSEDAIRDIDYAMHLVKAAMNVLHTAHNEDEDEDLETPCDRSGLPISFQVRR
jgi:hypothetical protein